MSKPSDIWFVASISETQAWSRSHESKASTSASFVNTSTSRNPLQWVFGRSPCTTFTFRGGTSHFAAKRERELCCSAQSVIQKRKCCSEMFATITTDNFSVTSRSHSLGLLPAVYGPDFPLLDMLQQHFAPKTSIVVSTQRQVIQNVERACLWLTTWPRRIKAWHTEHQEAVRTAGNHSHRSTAISKASREAQRISDQAIAAERECRPDLAAELLEKLSRIHPHAETLARLSKQYTDMSYLILQADAAARSSTVDLNIKAVELALKAVATDPTNALGHIALCVSRGRLALVSDNRKKIQLAKDAADDAATAMRLDPYNDYAHHLMGRWHFEMAQLNAVVRTLIRICFGTTLMEGSFSEALSCYRKAAELNPGRVIHRVEIGRTLIKLGNVQAGLEHLQQAIDMDIEDINAKLQQDDAAMLLKKLRAGKREDLYIKNETRS